MLQEPPLNNLDGDMTPEEINKSVSDCKTEIDKLNQKIDEMQDECRHSEYDVKAISMTPAQIKKVCRVCQADLGYPSKDELEKAGY